VNTKNNNPLSSVEEPGPDVSPKNAWRYIWIYPRQVFQSALRNFQGKYVVLIFALSGLSSDYSIVRLSEAFNSSFIITFLYAIAGSMILSYLISELFSWLLCEAGKIFGGHASYKEMRTVLAWSLIPTVGASVLSVGDIIVRVQSSVSQDVPIKSSFLASLLTALSTVQFALGIWTFILLMVGVKTVQNFSYFKSILNMLLPFLVLLCIFTLLIFIS
jgi:hypothetical protein